MTKKSLFIICSDPIVIAQHLVELAEYISNGFAVSFVTNLTHLNKYPSLLKLSDDFSFHHIPITRNPSIVDVIAFFKLFLVLVRYKPCIVLSFTPKGGLLSSLCSLFIILFPFRLIHIHYFTGILWQSLPFYAFKRHILCIADFFVLLSSKVVYCDSSCQKDFLSLSFPLFKDKVRVLGSGSLKGVDLDRFYCDDRARSAYRQQMNLTPDSFLLVYVGRISMDKNIDLLINSFTQLSFKYSHINLLLVGPIEDIDFYNIFNKSISRISHIGFTDNLQPIYNAADLLCLPSKREGFGSVVLEAAACKCTTVGSFIPGLVDSIDHLRTGLLFSLSFNHSLLQSLEFLINNPSVRHVLSNNAYVRVSRDFKQSNVLNLFYHDLLKNSYD